MDRYCGCNGIDKRIEIIMVPIYVNIINYKGYNDIALTFFQTHLQNRMIIKLIDTIYLKDEYIIKREEKMKAFYYLFIIIEFSFVYFKAIHVGVTCFSTVMKFVFDEVVVNIIEYILFYIIKVNY